MTLYPQRVSGTVLAVGLCFAGLAAADGGPSNMSGAQNKVIGQATYRCKGGIMVHVTQMPNSARVDFAGQTQMLDLTQGAGSIAYNNNQFSWFSKGKISYMKRIGNGSLVLTNCTPV